jgi:arylsulfatase A-like enzyme
MDLTAIWQPAPHPSMPERVQVLTAVDAPTVQPPDDAPHVLLVTIDTWRADRLGLYGSPRATSTWLEDFAKDAVVFERAIAPASWTWPTMASLATGMYPRGHGAMVPDAPICDEADTLAEVFHDAGWRTGFVGSNTYFEPDEAGYKQGFEYYFASGSESARRVLEYTGYFLDGGWTGSEPFFLHVHFFDPHCPYDPEDTAVATVREVEFGPTDFGSEPVPTIGWDMIGHACHVLPVVNSDLAGPLDQHPLSTDITEYLDHYDAELVETDRALQLLMATLNATGAWDDTWVVLTGDHGEEFGEHGRVGHGDNLYAETSWVPLLIRPPGGTTGRRISQPVSLVDIPRTLASVAGLKVPRAWDGRDLGPAVRGAPLEPAPVFSETVYKSSSWTALIVEEDLRLSVRGRRPIASMYSASDRMDRKDLFEQPIDLFHRVRAASMAGRLRRELQCQTVTQVCADARMELDPSHWDALQSLGYTVEVNSQAGGQAPLAPTYDLDDAARRRAPDYPTDCP